MKYDPDMDAYFYSLEVGTIIAVKGQEYKMMQISPKNANPIWVSMRMNPLGTPADYRSGYMICELAEWDWDNIIEVSYQKPKQEPVSLVPSGKLRIFPPRKAGDEPTMIELINIDKEYKRTGKISDYDLGRIDKARESLRRSSGQV